MAEQPRANGKQRGTDYFDPENPHGYWAGTEQDKSRGNQNGGRGVGSGPIGGGHGKGSRHAHSPLGDPEFFTNADVRAYCETGRALLMQLSFETSLAAEVLNAVLAEVPDPEGKPFGSRLRARRVSRRLSKTADDLKDAAKHFAATYAAFQREYSPELEPHRARTARPRRRFDFGQ